LLGKKERIIFIFSLNNLKAGRRFHEKKSMLRGLGVDPDCRAGAVCLFGVRSWKGT
jgi:hypothetical protein